MSSGRSCNGGKSIFHDVQAIIEVFAELALANQLRQPCGWWRR